MKNIPEEAGTLVTVARVGSGERVAAAVRPWPAGSKTKSSSMEDLLPVVETLLDNFGPLPKDRNARVVIKPNIHKDMNALMGNTTDLRLVAAVLGVLADRGYRDVTIAEGPNCGVCRFGIDAFRRSGLTSLANRFGVPVVDLNFDDFVHFTTKNGDRVRVSRTIFRADYLINLPKFKTHHLAGLSLCLKSLMGVVTAMDKRIMHNSLAENILSLNCFIRPALHIVDGLVAMEGQGPGLGEPLRLDLLVAGRRPAVVDALCASLAGFDPWSLPLTRLAREEGLVSAAEAVEMDSVPVVHRFKPSRYTLKNRIVDMKGLVWLRNLTRPFFDNEVTSALLFQAGIREDEFISGDGDARPRHLQGKCRNCGRCREVCPLGKKEFADDGCLGCGYCTWVCPWGANEYYGDLGYLERYIDIMLDKTRNL